MTSFHHADDEHFLANFKEQKDPSFATLLDDRDDKPVAKNLHSSLFQDPSTNNEPTNETYQDLEMAVNQNSLDIYKAGKAVHEGYLRGDQNISEQVSQFVLKYTGRVTASQMPPPEMFVEEDFFFIVTHGYGIMSQLSLSAFHSDRSRSETETMDLGALTGAVCNFNTTITRRYPSFPPFCGDVIDVKCEIPRRKNMQAHVYVKKLIFTMLSRACSNPKDIQDITWSIPEDSSTLRSPNPTPFPRGLYDDIQSIILEYFQLDDEILCRAIYDEEACKNMNCLKGITDPIARKNRYYEMHKARKVLLSTTYHYQFKGAIADLRRSTYIPPPPGHRFGIFKLLAHTKRRRTEDSEERGYSYLLTNITSK
uniref:Uncharacterized protein n=1 Tax=Caenorhabditis japonica TaxID=281687 RepID=A0A8R1E3X5_CAEJA